MRKNSIKNTRINMEVQRELSEIIRGEVKDPRIHPMTTVVSVEVTPDLKYCKAYISVLGEEESAKATIQGLKSAEGYIRRELARRVNLPFFNVSILFLEKKLVSSIMFVNWGKCLMTIYLGFQ